MPPVQCRLKPLNLARDRLNQRVLFSIHNSQEINFKVHRENRPIKEVTPVATYDLKNEFLKHHGHFFDKTYLEVACGTGDFLCAMARTNPGVNFIGVDHALPVIERAVLKAENNNLNNLLFYCGSAEDFFSFDMINETFNLIMFNFPDPWPKKRHHKRRIIQPNLVAKMARVLTKDGIMVTATDTIELYYWHREILNKSELIEVPLDKIPPAIVEAYSIASTYEKKGRESNRNIYYTYHGK